MTEHLYIHIPFCNSICKYCDFKRELKSDKTNNYLKKIVCELRQVCKQKQFRTIYIGGGTPNCLSNEQLNFLLSNVKKYLSNHFEFTIECNPECVNNSQVEIMKKNKINRISLGVQTTNKKILSLMNRKHTLKDVVKAIKIFYKNNINNVSCDFIYGFNELSKKDIKKSIKFLIKNKIKHVSFYQLELKENAFLTKYGYKIDDELSDEQFIYVLELLKKYRYKRYEISNWAIDEKYQSKHNLAYWESNDWKAIGYGGCGFENKSYYENIGSISSWNKKSIEYSNQEYYQQILMMGLRLIDGIDLNIKRNQLAYNYYKNSIKNDVIIKNSKLIVKEINLLNNTLEKLF